MEGMDAGELVQKVKLTIPVTSLNLITQLCHLLDTLLKDSGHYTDPNVSGCATPPSLLLVACTGPLLTDVDLGIQVASYTLLDV